MASQMTGTRKATITNLTNVWFQSGVRSLMYNSRLFPSKSLVAHVAGILNDETISRIVNKSIGKEWQQKLIAES